VTPDSSNATVAARVVLAGDGLRLEAELATPSNGVDAAVVLCHPHPQYGGTMRSIVISALFAALPAHRIQVLRFNFRGVDGSEGVTSGGDQEPHDVAAALEALERDAGRDVPKFLVGWSFGGDMALSVADARVRGWIAIAPPLRFGAQIAATGRDERPKLLVLAQHDEVQRPEVVIEAVREWRATRVEVVPGASHFFMGRTDRVVDAVLTFVREHAGV
jgi:alpha/beta superfamily hydrolase